MKIFPKKIISFRYRLFLLFVVNFVFGLILAHYAKKLISKYIEIESFFNETLLFYSLAFFFSSILFFLTIRLATQAINIMVREICKQLGDNPTNKIDMSKFPELKEIAASIKDFADSVEKEKQIAVMIQKAAIQRAVMVEYDSMTGLYNKKFLYSMLPQEVSRAQALSDKVSLLMIDVDDFKVYNDKNGHVEGDKLLKKIGDLLKENTRNVDICVRYGGEEFTVILPKTDTEKAVTAAERIRQAIEAYNFYGEEKQPLKKVTVSVGLATFPIHANSPEELIIKADEVLYEAKKSGKNKVIIYKKDTQ